MSALTRLAAWYARLSFSQGLLLHIAVIFFLCILTALAIWWFDPRRVEMRAIRRKRRQRKSAIRILRAPSPLAERHCFRDVKGGLR